MNGTRTEWKRLLGAILALCMAYALTPCPASAVETGISLYESYASDGSVTLHAELLESVNSAESAAAAVSRQAAALTEEQKQSPADVDQIAFFAEAAIAAAARRQIQEEILQVSKAAVEDLAEAAKAAREQVEDSLRQGGIPSARSIADTVTLETEADSFTLIIHSDILDTEADRIRVERTAAPAFALTIRPADLLEELRPNGPQSEPRTLTIKVTQEGEECEPGTDVRIPRVHVEVPGGQLSAPILLSLNPGSAEPASLLIRGEGGEASASRYNPATRTMDARIDASDIYTFGRGGVQFGDISEKNRKMRSAIESLARVNVVYGYSDQSFRPDRNVTRAEFVAFIMRALGKVNNSLKSPFVDVQEGSGCYHEIASAYYHGIIKGYDAEHFRGDQLISKTQIYAILGRILESEMGYLAPENPAEFLAGEYADPIAEWAQSNIALATREGLVIRQDTGRFDGHLMMNRGDVALVIYGLYQRLA